MQTSAGARIQVKTPGVMLSLALLAASAVSAGQAEGLTAPPPVEAIALRLEQMNTRRSAALKSYESHRLMMLHYKGLIADRRASEELEMRFTGPATKTFTVISSTGSVLLRDGVFAREIESEQLAAEPKVRAASALTPGNYNLRLAGTERLPEGDCYVLEVSPKTSNRFAFTGRVWVQDVDYAVVRIQAAPAVDPSFWVRDEVFTASYEKVGDFWLPSRTVSSSHIRLGGNATFTMIFGPYRILDAGPVSPL